MKLNEEEIRKALGYCGLFASRDTVKEANEYVNTVANACGKNNKLGVLTAAAVLVNSYIDHIIRHYDLTPKAGQDTGDHYSVCESCGSIGSIEDVGTTCRDCGGRGVMR